MSPARDINVGTARWLLCLLILTKQRHCFCCWAQPFLHSKHIYDLVIHYLPKLLHFSCTAVTSCDSCLHQQEAHEKRGDIKGLLQTSKPTTLLVPTTCTADNQSLDPDSSEQVYSTLLSDTVLTWKTSMPKGDMQVSNVMMSHRLWPWQW